MVRELHEKVYTLALPEEVDALAAKLIDDAGQLRVWLFSGELGAGKTTLIKSICRQLGVEHSMSSPTFSIINEYETPAFDRIYHFDFYRIRHEAEAYDMGVEDYFYSGRYCFIEWPDKIPSLIPAAFVNIHIAIQHQSQRAIVISIHDREEENRI